MKMNNNDIAERDDAELMLLTSDDICSAFRIGRRTLLTWRQSGRFPLPDLKVGKTIRWQRATVADWLAEQSPQGQRESRREGEGR